MTNHLTRRGMTAVASGVCTVLLTASAVAADRINDRISNLDRIQGNRLDAPIQRSFNRDVIHHSLASASGRQQVIVRLNLDAAANASDKATRKHDIAMQQRDFLQRCGHDLPGMRVIAQTQLVLNAVFIEVDVAHLDAIARDPAVSRIAPVANYQVDLSETVPYIGAAAAQGAGIDGSGITVAVLDSGLDYTHANLGGSGDPADFAANDPVEIESIDGVPTFPTAKVVGGFDFVGSIWPNGPDGFAGPLHPDPDPIDDGFGGGHGTHVGDIIGGVGGVAPGVDLVGVKVCSSVSSSCSGIALIQGMEFAVDPNGDGNPDDAVDIINMSLGSNYGQPFDDDLVAAVNNATALGVLTVASAGNGSDKPYVTGTPAAAGTALSVAQTQVPSAALQFLKFADMTTQAEFQAWSKPLIDEISGVLQYADGAGGNLNGCAPFAPGSLNGLVVLVDRGACNFTLKIKNIGVAGGALGIIGQDRPGAAFAGGDGGDRPIDIPAFMIDQANATAYKDAINGTLELVADPNITQTLVMQMVGSSSRGPRNGDNGVKPEIGAPGASVSAVAGTGTGVGAFGGTSGAAPMVSGSAALLAQAYEGEASPQLIKALLFNNGETGIDTDPFSGLAPITRIGGGEVRVDSSLMAIGAAWDKDTGGALSFGQIDADKQVKLKRNLIVTNTSDEKVRYNLSSSFRFADDEASGAVDVRVKPDHVTVKPGKSKKVKVELRIDPANLPGNFMNSGSNGANPGALTANEFDGYITLDDGTHPIHVPWHVLPRQAANVKTEKKFEAGGGILEIENKGAGIAQMDAYALLAVSGNQPEGAIGAQSPTPDIRAVGINTFPVPAGFCSGQDSFVWVFAINTWERQTHLVPVSHQVELDIDQDGTVDYVVLNRDLSGLGTIGDGRQVTYAFDVANESASIFFFAEHATNTGNTVLTVCGEQVGLTGTDMMKTNVDMNVIAQDFYFGGPGDEITGLTVTPLGERFFLPPGDIDLGAGEKGTIEVLDAGDFDGNSPELGILLITNGDRGPGARGGATQKTEATIIALKGADLSALKDEGDDDDDEDDDDDDDEEDDDD